MLVETTAIVLRRMRYGDTSIIATLLTADRGVESIIAKGARSAKSRMAALLEPFEELQVQYYVKPGRELHILRSAERVAIRHRIHSSYDHLLAALALVEIVLRLELPGHPAPDVFVALSDALAALDAAESTLTVIPIAFALRFAAAHGFSLEGDSRVIGALSDQSSEEYIFGVRFDEGKIVALDDRERSDAVQLAPMVARALLEIAATPFERLKSLSFAESVLYDCWAIAQRYLEYHFERRLSRTHSGRL
jgi:DNA repair protein RecO (recombination protein O)